MEENEDLTIFQTLRTYQIAGIQWLLSLHKKNRNGILADEMGLGKTIQTLTFLQSLKEECNIYGPHLIVLPLSVINSWISEIDRCISSGMDNFGTYIHYGERSVREEQFKQIRNLWKESCSLENQSSQKKKVQNQSRKIFLIFFTYDMVLKDIDLLLQFHRLHQFYYLIVDEAHRLKNNESVLYHNLLKLTVERKILLTGTPIQNTVKELLSLLYFISSNANSSMSTHSKIIDEDLILALQELEASIINEIDGTFNAEGFIRSPKKRKEFLQNKKLGEESQLVFKLQESLKPYILRRTKEEVCVDLPPKVEKIIYCPLSPLQIQIHDLLKRKLESEVQTEKMKRVLPRELLYDGCDDHEYTFNNIVIQLRKICDHSYLFLEDIKTIPDDMYFRHLIASSGKLAVLDKLLDSLLLQNSKILLFSQLTTMLNILEGYLQIKQIPYVRLDGNTDRFDREEAIYTFQNEKSDDAPKIFLLSTRAGGVGINLQQADTVILYDSDWNPQQDIQAISRAHRIGQEKAVLVLRLVSLGPDKQTLSVDEYMIRNAQRKLITERKIFKEGKFNDGEQFPTVVELDKEKELERLFHDDETEMESVQSFDSAEKIISILFAKRSSENELSDEKDYNIKLDQHQLHAGRLYERRNFHTESYIAPEFENKDYSSCWKTWLEQLQPRTRRRDLEESSISRTPRKRSSVSRNDNTDKDIDFPLDMTNDLDDDDFFPVKRLRTRRQNRNSVATKSLRQKRKLSVKNIGQDTESAEDDICCVCGRFWVTVDESKEIQLLYSEEQQTDSTELCETLILCDGCEGSFHMICVGLKDVPAEDWYCYFCSNLSTASLAKLE